MSHFLHPIFFPHSFVLLLNDSCFVWTRSSSFFLSSCGFLVGYSSWETCGSSIFHGKHNSRCDSTLDSIGWRYWRLFLYRKTYWSFSATKWCKREWLFVSRTSCLLSTLCEVFFLSLFMFTIRGIRTFSLVSFFFLFLLCMHCFSLIFRILLSFRVFSSSLFKLFFSLSYPVSAWFVFLKGLSSLLVASRFREAISSPYRNDIVIGARCWVSVCYVSCILLTYVEHDVYFRFSCWYLLPHFTLYLSHILFAFIF